MRCREVTCKWDVWGWSAGRLAHKTHVSPRAPTALSRPRSATPRLEPVRCASKKIVRFRVPSLVFTVDRFFASIPFETTAPANRANGIPSSVLNFESHKFEGPDHEYLSPCQPDRCLRRQHHFGIGQHCEVRATSPLKVKAPVPDCSLACDGLEQPCLTSRIASVQTKTR